jgi:hypothetical protein
MRILGVMGFLACATPCRAADVDHTSNFLSAIELQGFVGHIDGEHSGGFTLGATGRLRYSVLTAGVSVLGATQVLGSTMVASSALGGLTLPLGQIRLDALGEFGANSYSGVGSGFLSDDPGASATLPFAGARIGVLGRFSQDWEYC